MTSQIASLGLHLPGLLKLLGEHLYSDPRVAFRELIQNAHDSTVRRRLELGHETREKIEVEVYERDGRSFVRFSDRGIGMTREEIERFLSTIGRGRTREVRDAQIARAEVLELVGQFGVGVLAAFLIGDRVIVHTRRAGDPEAAGWQWICDGQQTYRLEPYEFEREGTDVIVRIREDRLELAGLPDVRAAITRYARFLPTPIHVGDRRINERLPEWIEPAAALTDEELGRSVCDDEPPLWTLRLRPFEDDQLGLIQLHGVLAIPPDSHLSVQEYGHVAVFVRHMMITRRDTELLPGWARFVTGVIDCPQLEPTASRETIRRERVYARIREEIGGQLLRALNRLQREEAATWRAITGAHATLIKRDAIRSPALFEVVADELPFETTRGRMTLPDYLQASKGTIYCHSDESQARTMGLLLEASSRPVIDAKWYADEPFLHYYSRVRGVPLVRETPTGDPNLVERASEDDLPRMFAALQEPGVVVRPSRFSPKSLPMLLYTPRQLLLREFAEHVVAHDQDDHLAGLLGDYAQRREGTHRLLFVNVDHPLLRAAEALEPAMLRAVAKILKEHARLLGGERLPFDTVVDSVEAMTAGVHALVETLP